MGVCERTRIHYILYLHIARRDLCITCGNCQYLKWIFRTKSLAPLVWHSAATVGRRQKKRKKERNNNNNNNNNNKKNKYNAERQETAQTPKRRRWIFNLVPARPFYPIPVI
jgi:hypothetical protein